MKRRMLTPEQMVQRTFQRREWARDMKRRAREKRALQPHSLSWKVRDQTIMTIARRMTPEEITRLQQCLDLI